MVAADEGAAWMIFKPPPRPPRSRGGTEYRLYFLDGAGHIQTSHEFEAASDDEAIRIAQAWWEGRRIELWQRARLVLDWD